MVDKKEVEVRKIRESIVGVNKLSPGKVETASVQGIDSLKPENLKPSSSSIDSDKSKGKE